MKQVVAPEPNGAGNCTSNQESTKSDKKLSKMFNTSTINDSAMSSINGYDYNKSNSSYLKIIHKFVSNSDNYFV